MKLNWWEGAYTGNDNITVKYKFEHNSDLIEPRTPLRFKNVRGVFKFRCIATNIETSARWIDCMDHEGQMRSFDVSVLKGVDKPKRLRRKKT